MVGHAGGGSTRRELRACGGPRTARENRHPGGDRTVGVDRVTPTPSMDNGAINTSGSCGPDERVLGPIRSGKIAMCGCTAGGHSGPRRRH